MGKISTRELFDEYKNTHFEGKSNENINKLWCQLDRPELYEYEIEIGKEFIDMTVDDFINFFIKLVKKNRRSGVSYNSFPQIVSGYRSIVEYYIDKYNVIKNPFSDKRLKGRALIDAVAKTEEPYTWDTVNKIISALYSNYDEDRAKYIECIMRLYIDGFQKANEIVELKEEMIDFEKKEIHLERTTIKISDRCAELLKFVRGLKEMINDRGVKFKMMSWKGRYFPYAVSAHKIDSFDETEPSKLADKINRKLTQGAGNIVDTPVGYSVLYFFGFFNYIVKEIGEGRAHEIILSYRDKECADILVGLAREYGIKEEKASVLKQYLIPYLYL